MNYMSIIMIVLFFICLLIAYYFGCKKGLDSGMKLYQDTMQKEINREL